MDVGDALHGWYAQLPTFEDDRCRFLWCRQVLRQEAGSSYSACDIYEDGPFLGRETTRVFLVRLVVPEQVRISAKLTSHFAPSLPLPERSDAGRLNDVLVVSLGQLASFFRFGDFFLMDSPLSSI